jgi:hypothetical protein
MKIYEKEIEGKIVRKPLEKIIIENDGMTTYNPTEEMVLADGWVLYDPVVEIPEETEEEKLENARNLLIGLINDFDSSVAVNCCHINCELGSFDYWADKHERDSLKNAVRDCITMGRDVYRLDLREFGISLTIPCDKLLEMLSALEVYAIDCYNKTTDHIFAVNDLNSIEEIESYDYHNGYPEKLSFDLSENNE